MGHVALKRLLVPLLAAALFAPLAARANGFALDIQGVFSNGTATAGAASGHDPAGQLANPAVLASLEGTQVVLGGQVILGKAPYTDAGSTLLGGMAPIAGTNGDGAQTGAAPWLFASHRLSPEWAVGFAFTAPFGLATKYDGTFFGRYQGLESRVESIAFGPAVAWRPIPSLAIGVGVAARRDHALVSQALDGFTVCYGGAAQLGDPDPAATCGAQGLAPGNTTGTGSFDADGWSWTGTAGVTWAPVEGTTLGVGYRHEAKSTVKGKQTFDAVAQAIGLAPTANGSVDLPLPDFLTVSLEQKIAPAVSLLAAFQYTFWSSWDTLHIAADVPNGLTTDIAQGYRNAFRVSGAALWTVRPGVDLFGGVAYEQSPLTDTTRDTNLAETDSLIAGLGGEAKLWKGLSVGAVYQRVQPLSSAKIDRTGSAGDRVVGEVSGAGAHVFALQLGWRS